MRGAACIVCAADLYCPQAANTTDGAVPAPTCAAQKADGMSCFDNVECSNGGCNRATSDMPGTCGAPTTCDGQ